MGIENKITIEHLSAYLPYGLEVKKRVGGEVLQMMSLSTVTHKGQICIETYSGTYGDMWFKPILRPLSDLTKEIEHNGERFVPFEEIAKIECPNISGAVEKIHSITAFNRGLSFKSTQMGVMYRYEGVTVEITHFKDAIFHKRVVNGNDSWVFSYFHNYPTIIQKLLSWHFDIFGLIESGLAVEKQRNEN